MRIDCWNDIDDSLFTCLGYEKFFPHPIHNKALVLIPEKVDDEKIAELVDYYLEAMPRNQDEKIGCYIQG